MPYRIKILMRPVNKTSHGVLNEGVHEEQNEVLVMGGFMLLQRVYVFMFCKVSMLYVLHRAYFLCFAEGLFSMFC